MKTGFQPVVKVVHYHSIRYVIHAVFKTILSTGLRNENLNFQIQTAELGQPMVSSDRDKPNRWVEFKDVLDCFKSWLGQM